jgi:hypothetical protein
MRKKLRLSKLQFARFLFRAHKPPNIENRAQLKLAMLGQQLDQVQMEPTRGTLTDVQAKKAWHHFQLIHHLRNGSQVGCNLSFCGVSCYAGFIWYVCCISFTNDYAQQLEAFMW